MRVYLAGPSAELDRVKSAAASLRAAGFTITEPWWERTEQAALAGWLTDADVPPGYMRTSAERNYRGILVADFFVGLCKTAGGLSSGHSYEVGVAGEIMRPPCTRILVGDPRGFVGMWIGDVRVVPTIEAAIGAMR